MLDVIWITTILSCILKGETVTYEPLKVIAMGPTGVGKSSLVNWWTNKGIEIAKEGQFESLTSNVTFYHIDSFNLDLGDTPGLRDTRGYSDHEISELIKSSMIEQSNHIISGVLLMFDIRNVRHYLEDCVAAIVKIFGEEVLEKVIFVLNRNEGRDVDERYKRELKGLYIDRLNSIYAKFKIQGINIEDRIFFIDTKGDFDKYSSKLYNKLITYFDTKGMNVVEQDQKIQQDIEKYYQMEINDKNNYNTKTWQYQCHCHKSCDWNIGFAKGGCSTHCHTCTKSETYLKYPESHLREVAIKKVSSKIQEKVFAALRDRQREL